MSSDPYAFTTSSTSAYLWQQRVAFATTDGELAKRGSLRTLRNYRHVIGRRDIARFTEGDCHILALELERLMGWSLAAFTWHGKPDAHCFNVVQHPQGHGWLGVDIEGAKPMDEFCKHWEIPLGRWGRFTPASITVGGWELSWQVTKWSPIRANQVAPIIAREAQVYLESC